MKNFEEIICYIDEIINNNKISWFKKFIKINEIKYVKKNLKLFKTLLNNIKLQIQEEDDLENESYSQEIFIPIENVDDLFGENYEILYNKYIENNSPRKIRSVSEKNYLKYG